MNDGSLRLKELRKKAKLNQTELAELYTEFTGKPKRQVDISRLETGYVELSYSDAVIFVQIFKSRGVTSDDGTDLRLEDLADFDVETWTAPPHITEGSLVTA